MLRGLSPAAQPGNSKNIECLCLDKLSEMDKLYHGEEKEEKGLISLDIWRDCYINFPLFPSTGFQPVRLSDSLQVKSTSGCLCRLQLPGNARKHWSTCLLSPHSPPSIFFKLIIAFFFFFTPVVPSLLFLLASVCILPLKLLIEHVHLHHYLTI